MTRTLALLAALTALSAADPDPRPAQFRIWGTVAPLATDRIAAPAPYQEVLPAGFDPGPDIAVSPELAARGLLPFRCHPQGLLHPRLRPGPADLADPALAGFAAQGEYASLCLGVHALRDLAAAAASATDLAGEGGARLDAANLDLRWVKFLPNPVARFVYRLDPLVLERRPSKEVEAGASAFLWLTVHVPPGTPPGIYRSSLRLAAAGCPAQQVPLAFRVLDLGLEDPDRHLAMLYSFGRAGVASGDPTRLDSEFADMALHGMNALSYIQMSPQELAGAAGPRFDFAQESRIGRHGLSPRRILDAARDAGLRRDAVLNLAMIPSYSQLWTGTAWGTEACDDHLRRLAAAWAGEAARAGDWPRLMFNVGDEPTARNGRLEPARRLGAQVKAGAPSIPTTCFCVGGYLGEDDLAVLDPVLDVAVVPVLPKAEYRDALVRRGKPFWLYNSARPDRPLDARLAFGWHLIGTGAAGMEQFMYRTIGGCAKGREWESAFLRWPEQGFDDLEPTWCYSWRVDDGCLPSPAFESIRAGVADLRYVQTAAALAVRAAADPRPAMRQAGVRALERLAALRSEFAYFLPNGSFRGVEWLHAAGTELLDLRRWELARMILDLRGQGQAVAPAASATTRLALAGVDCRPASPAPASRPLALAAISGEAPASASPFLVLGSARSGRPQPARHQTRFSARAGPASLDLMVHADEPDTSRPKRVDGGIWSQDGIELFLASPAQDGLIHQIAATALGEVGLLTHRRTDRARAELVADLVAAPPPGLTATAASTTGGWQLAVTVPWSALGLAGPPSPGEVWGLNLCRTRRGEAPAEAAERSSWSPLEGRFLEPSALGRLAIARDPGLSSSWCEAVGGEQEAFAVLEVENRGPARRLPVTVDGATHTRVIPAGSSRLILPLPEPTRPRPLAIRGEGGALLATLSLSGPPGGDLEVAGVGSRRGDGSGGRGIRPALGVPCAVWPHARAIPVRFDLPVAGGGLTGQIEVRDGGRILLRQALTGLDSAEGRLALSADGLVPGRTLDLGIEIGGIAFRTGLRIGDGFLD
jgi:hypothetical protein